MNRGVRTVRTVKSDGADAFHVVELEGGGFVVAAADDGIEPVVAFSETGSLVEDRRNPLWVLLNRDLPARAKARREGARPPSGSAALRGRGGRRHVRKEPSAEWGELLADDSTRSAIVATAGQPSVADVRVPALVRSTWDQSAVNSRPCYNYFTPNNYVCGCVATAAAQVMRYHGFPTGAVEAQTKSCSVDGVAVTKTMMGGTYDWNSMPLTPTSAITEAQRQAIGRLCYDIGVAARMDWSVNGSGAVDAVLAPSLSSIFGFASAKCELADEITDAQFEDAIYANLDAGFPVLLGIQTDDLSGHEVIADGYGLSGDTIYTHLNMGWSGSYNVWYALPEVSAGYNRFTAVGGLIYNLFPTTTGELVTGRALDAEGLPVAGASVTCSATYRSGWSQKTEQLEDRTNERGIFALCVPSGSSCSILVSAPGRLDVSIRVTVGTSRSTTFRESDLTYTSGSGSIGNRWGNDVVLKKAYWTEEPEWADYTQVTLSAGASVETRHRGVLTKAGYRYAWGRNGVAATDWIVGDGTPCELDPPAGEGWELMVKDDEEVVR